jgi:hypothetical protein
MVQGRAEASDERHIADEPPHMTLVDDGFTTVLRIRTEVLRGWEYSAT